MKLPIIDFSRNNQEAEAMKLFLDNFQKYDNFVKVLVEVNQSGLGENDFLFRIVGEYKHL